MSMWQPRRWCDDRGAGLDPELSAALHALRAQTGTAVQRTALERRLARELAAPSVASGASASAALLSGKLLLSGLLSVVLVIALSFLRHEDERTPRTAAAPAPAAAPAASVAPPAPPVVVSAPTPAGAADPLAAAHPRADVRPSRARHAPRALRHPAGVVPAPDPERELSLLRRAQAALDHDPATALALASEHARAFPDGVFAQEREVLAIEALLKQKQRQRALLRAEAFVRRFPRSPHVRRVQALLDRSIVPRSETIEGATGDSLSNPRP